LELVLDTAWPDFNGRQYIVSSAAVNGGIGVPRNGNSATPSTPAAMIKLSLKVTVQLPERCVPLPVEEDRPEPLLLLLLPPLERASVAAAATRASVAAAAAGTSAVATATGALAVATATAARSTSTTLAVATTVIAIVNKRGKQRLDDVITL